MLFVFLLLFHPIFLFGFSLSCFLFLFYFIFFLFSFSSIFPLSLLFAPRVLAVLSLARRRGLSCCPSFFVRDGIDRFHAVLCWMLSLLAQVFCSLRLRFQDYFDSQFFIQPSDCVFCFFHDMQMCNDECQN